MTTKRSNNNINVPLDLTFGILNQLPTKSLARFQCVSKQWISMITESIVINSIVTRSLNEPPSRDPHFIFDWRSSKPELSSVFSYAYPLQVTNEGQIYHDEMFGKLEGSNTTFQHVRGLIGFSSLYYDRYTIFNPTTKQSISLPIHRFLPPPRFYLFGYDPLKNQYKVLCLTQKRIHPEILCCQIFTLGDPNKEWMGIQCGIGRHIPFGNAVCINGEIYNKARMVNRSYVLVSFDVRSQNFSHVEAPVESESSNLLNYQGKLACICDDTKDVEVWIMESAEKQEWSKIIIFDLLQGLTRWMIRFADVTNPVGEIVIVHQDILNKLKPSVYFYDGKRKICRGIDIETTTSLGRLRPSDYVAIWAITDPVENIMCL